MIVLAPINILFEVITYYKEYTRGLGTLQRLCKSIARALGVSCTVVGHLLNGMATFVNINSSLFPYITPALKFFLSNQKILSEKYQTQNPITG